MNTEHSNSVQDDGMGSQSGKGEQALSRRRALGVAAKAGAATAALGLLAGLTGCGSSAQRRSKGLGTIGDPIAPDPVVSGARPGPVRPSARTPIIEPGDGLAGIPSFVVGRSKWTSAEPKRWLADPMGRVNRVTVHHDAIMPVPSGSYADSLRRMQLIRTGHLNNGWADIGYHFAIDPSGRVWEARPLELQGAHVKDHNPGNLGIVVFGNYEQMRPTGASLQAVEKLIAYAMDRFNVPLSQVRTHQELRPTACPGRFLQEHMNRTRGSGGRLAQLAGKSGTHS